MLLSAVLEFANFITSSFFTNLTFKIFVALLFLKSDSLFFQKKFFYLLPISSDISQSESNKAMKFRHLIEYNKINIFLQESC